MTLPESTETPLETTEDAHPDRREHAKASPHIDDDELARRTQHERELVERDRG
ncbi:MAG: hypothetical protein AVDCRST_MAG66-2533 [uncultured Pseudonocardia sp.]|uniref:Uncharacterized protein n=1 Tax=uncultured Pseudonocardia sp. TaxID=211455 RepID=A0A6J4PT79_9PSEU|nr:MAG: hypothetical protein AVDCRST_MAG66-2533 [uncultured Pseudonocardia sp.]